MEPTVYEYRWLECADHYRALAAGEYDNSRKYPASRAQAERCRRASGGPHDWMGASMSQVSDWLDNGYDFTSAATQVASVTDTERTRWMWSDDPEGEFDYDTFATGETDCFRKRTTKKHLGGITVRVRYSFNSTANADTIASYGVLVGSALEAIQQQGIDTEVSIDSYATKAYRNTSGQVLTRLNVKSFGEPTMMREWSAIFSPGGVRHISWTARALGELEGRDRKPNPQLGRATSGSKWDVTFDAETRTMEFWCDSGGSRFPADEMAAKLENLKTEIG